MVSNEQLRNAGKAWRACDPDGFRMWSREEGTQSMVRAGRYWFECDPDGFARLLEDYA
jgi:hypothetical protein